MTAIGSVSALLIPAVVSGPRCGFESLTIGRNWRINSSGCHFFSITANLLAISFGLEVGEAQSEYHLFPDCLTPLLYYVMGKTYVDYIGVRSMSLGGKKVP